MLRLVDAGEINLDDPVAPLVNVILQREANTTLEALCDVSSPPPCHTRADVPVVRV